LIELDREMVNLDVAYIPTPKDLVHQMLHIAQLRRGETLYDLGAGDGRILVEAARRFGAKSVGIEIDPIRVSRIRERLKTTGVVAEVIEGDFMEADMSKADVVTIYLSKSVNAKLAPKLRDELKDGARVVSLDYDLPSWLPEQAIDAKSAGLARRIYLYRNKRAKS
jgi:precorrin-6B methylase 2